MPKKIRSGISRSGSVFVYWKVKGLPVESSQEATENVVVRTPVVVSSPSCYGRPLISSGSIGEGSGGIETIRVLDDPGRDRAGLINHPFDRAAEIGDSLGLLLHTGQSVTNITGRLLEGHLAVCILTSIS